VFGLNCYIAAGNDTYKNYLSLSYHTPTS